ncbi:hypothetical protein [Kitasatospora atroaurantiaca]|nr:hypothetical protein [Kitasatospora atroaurantiaca]
MLTFPAADLFIAGPVVATLDELGTFSIALPATDAPNMNPSGWAYLVKENLSGVIGGRTFAALLPKNVPDVDLADIAPADPTTPNYVPVPGPKGDPGSVDSVNGKHGPNVVLDADSVGALPKWGGTLTGELNMSGPAGSYRTLNFQTGNVERWVYQVDNGAESGGDAGSNFELSNWSDAGAWKSSVIYGERSTGNVGIGTSSLTPNAKVTVRGPTSLILPTGSVERPLTVSAVDKPGVNLMEVRYTGSVRFAAGNVYADKGIRIGDATADLGGGSGLLALKDASPAPTAASAGASLLYSEGGILKVRQGNNSVITLGRGIADGSLATGQYAGQYRDGTSGLWRWDGSAWQLIGGWQSYTPTWGGLTALGSSTFSGRYRVLGKTVTAVAWLSWGTGSSLGTGNITVSLPMAAADPGVSPLGWQGTGRHVDGSNPWKSLLPDVERAATVATVFAVKPADGGWYSPGALGYLWGASGASMRIQVTYEAA